MTAVKLPMGAVNGKLCLSSGIERRPSGSQAIPDMSLIGRRKFAIGKSRSIDGERSVVLDDVRATRRKCVRVRTRARTSRDGASDGLAVKRADDVKVFNIPRKQAASTSGTKFELAETYSYGEFASRVVPQRALRHLAASRSPRLFSALSHGRP